MRFVTNARVVVGLFALACAPALYAQDFPAGTWTGTVTPPDGTVLDVTYEVTREEGTLTITLKSPEHGDFPCTDVRQENDSLSFSWSPGTTVLCELERQEDGSYAGDCVDAGGDPGRLVMIPPADNE